MNDMGTCCCRTTIKVKRVCRAIKRDITPFVSPCPVPHPTIKFASGDIGELPLPDVHGYMLGKGWEYYNYIQSSQNNYSTFNFENLRPHEPRCQQNHNNFQKEDKSKTRLE